MNWQFEKFSSIVDYSPLSILDLADLMFFSRVRRIGFFPIQFLHMICKCRKSGRRKEKKHSANKSVVFYVAMLFNEEENKTGSEVKETFMSVLITHTTSCVTIKKSKTAMIYFLHYICRCRN